MVCRPTQYGKLRDLDKDMKTPNYVKTDYDDEYLNTLNDNKKSLLEEILQYKKKITVKSGSIKHLKEELFSFEETKKSTDEFFNEAGKRVKKARSSKVAIEICNDLSKSFTDNPSVEDIHTRDAGTEEQDSGSEQWKDDTDDYPIFVSTNDE